MSVCRGWAAGELRCALSVISSWWPRNNVILSRNEERDVSLLPRTPPTDGDGDGDAEGGGCTW